MSARSEMLSPPGGSVCLGSLTAGGIKGPRCLRPAALFLTALAAARQIRFAALPLSWCGLAAKTPQRGCGALRRATVWEVCRG